MRATKTYMGAIWALFLTWLYGDLGDLGDLGDQMDHMDRGRRCWIAALRDIDDSNLNSQNVSSFFFAQWPLPSSGLFFLFALCGACTDHPLHRKPISLISHSDVRYRGILAGIDPAASTIQLSNGVLIWPSNSGALLKGRVL